MGVRSKNTWTGAGRGRWQEMVCSPVLVRISFIPRFLWGKKSLRHPALSSPVSRGLPEVG